MDRAELIAKARTSARGDAVQGPRVYTIGRYQIVGQLATGGMAEILLARIVGPMGFERPVVVKRILPHLASDPQFVRMFLDEARLAARISHRNVVTVQELGEHDDELYIVMEYLEGESLASLTRRLVRHGQRLDPALCAFVIAEAASGLHAAHELVDANGKPLELVHRDVSPHNVFVSYDGTVKVLDFGIATAADRLSHTEAGELKGKFEYMSPEQCSGRPVDRRSDVFSLGTLLWETITGHRLFKRNNKLLVLKAIAEGPIPPPSSVAPNTPPELDDVCMKALTRSRGDRYQTAAEVRRDLMRVTRQLAGDTVLDETLRELMFRLFDDRIDEKRQMLARLQAGSELTSLPAAEVDRAVELPSVEIELDMITGTGRTPPTLAPEVVVTQPKRQVPRVALFAVGVAVVAALTAAVLGAAGAGGDSSSDDRSATRQVSSARGEPSPPGRGATERTGAPLGAGRDPPPDVAQTGADAALPNREVASTVLVRVESTPVRADVTLDGEERGPTPIALTLQRASAALPLELHADGYASELMTLTPDSDQRIVVRLREEPAPRGGRPRSRRGPAKARKYHRFD